MRKLLALILLLISICLPVQASEQDIVNSFTNFTNSIAQEINTSYNNKDTWTRYVADKWVKIGRTNYQYSIDIKTTDSLINPYVGYLNASCGTIRYYTNNNYDGSYCTKEQADNANLSRISNTRINKRFIYNYQNGNWILKQVQYYSVDGYWKDDYLKSPIEHFSFKNK